jgi:hypothetical protein
VTDALDALALPRDAGLSVVAIEFLPSGGAVEPEPGQGQNDTDPLDTASFGRRRILRTSALTLVGAVCGVLEPAGTAGH